MPFPPFPQLPDDNPIRALQMFRNYVREAANSMAPHWLLTTSVAAPIFLFAAARLIFEFETVLSWASDLVPLTFAVISVIVSVKKLRDQHQTVVVAFVLVLGFLGSLVMHFSRTHAESAHELEIGELKTKMDSVGKQNDLLLKAFLEKPAITSSEVEVQRKQNILKALRSEYILSHDNVSPGLLAGTEYPPADWTNRRLQELREKWTVASVNPSPTSPTPARSYITITEKGLLFPADNTDSFDKGKQFKVGTWLGFNIPLRAAGPNAIEIIQTYGETYLVSDYSDETQKSTVDEFKKKLSAQGKGEPETKAPGDNFFFTAFKWDGGQRHNVTQLDLDDLHSGKEFAIVVMQVSYKDKGILHHLRQCELLQPPAEPPGIWALCSVFTKSD